MRYVTLKRRSQFKAATHSDIKFIGKFVIIQLGESQAYPSQRDTIDIGFTVSKKVGDSCQRNLVKRRLKAICRNLPLDPELYKGKYIVIIARKQINDAAFSQLTQELANGLNWVRKRCKC